MQPRPPTSKSTQPEIPKPRIRSSGSSRSIRATARPPRARRPARLQVALTLHDRWAQTHLARELLHAECDVFGLDDLAEAPHAAIVDLADDDGAAWLAQLAAQHPSTSLIAICQRGEVEARSLLDAVGVRRVHVVSGALRPRELAEAIVRLVVGD